MSISCSRTTTGSFEEWTTSFVLKPILQCATQPECAYECAGEVLGVGSVRFHGRCGSHSRTEVGHEKKYDLAYRIRTTPYYY